MAFSQDVYRLEPIVSTIVTLSVSVCLILSFYLSVWFYVLLPGSVYICLCICLFISFTASLQLQMPSFCLSICLYVCLYVCLSICMSRTIIMLYASAARFP